MDIQTLAVLVGMVATLVGGVAALNKLTRRGAVTDAEQARKMETVYQWFVEPGPEDDHKPLPVMARSALDQIGQVRQMAEKAAREAERAHEAAQLAQRDARLAHSTSQQSISELRDHMADEQVQGEERNRMLAQLAVESGEHSEGLRALTGTVAELQSSVASLVNPKE